MYYTLTVPPGKSLSEALISEHRKSPSLKVLQDAVGGFIETVPHLTSVEIDGKRRRCTAYVNETGRLNGLPRNGTMSVLWKSELLRQSPGAKFHYEPELFGSVVFVVRRLR